MELFRSVPLISANSINCFETSSRISPVSWKRVFTSPIAVPAVSASVGTSVKTFSMLPCRLSRASPVAPVFVITMSYPSSKSFADAYAAAPIAPAAADIGAIAFAAFPAFVLTVSKAFAAVSILLTLSAVSSAASATPSNSLLLSCACASRLFS